MIYVCPSGTSHITVAHAHIIALSHRVIHCSQLTIHECHHKKTLSHIIVFAFFHSGDELAIPKKFEIFTCFQTSVSPR